MYTIQGKYIRDSRKKTIEKFGESNYGCGGCHDHSDQSSCDGHGGCRWDTSSQTCQTLTGTCGDCSSHTTQSSCVSPCTWTPDSSGTGGTCS